MDGDDVLASATQYDLAAVLDQRSVRVCGIGSIISEPAHRDAGHARELVDRLLGGAGASRAVNRRTLLVVWRAIGGDLHDVRVVLGEPRIDARRIRL